MTAEARPSTDYFIANIDQQPDLVVAGEISDPTGSWEEWRNVYVAPQKPAYGLRGIQKVYDRFLNQGFKVCNSTYQDDTYLHLGSIAFDETTRKRLLISAYPDGEMAREAYEWDLAFHEGRGQDLRTQYASEGKKDPYTLIIPRNVLPGKWFHYQVARVISALTFWNRPASA